MINLIELRPTLHGQGIPEQELEIRDHLHTSRARWWRRHDCDNKSYKLLSFQANCQSKYDRR